MIERIKTENGERWAMVFDEHHTLEDIVNISNGMINLLQNYANNSELDNDSIYYGLEILSCLIPTSEQYYNYERYLKQTNQSKK